MSFQLVHFSNGGGFRPNNQDGYCIRVSTTPVGMVSMLAVCDGMGGMNDGEIASSTVIQSLVCWFDQYSSSLTGQDLTPEALSAELNGIVYKKHKLLRDYGERRGGHIGTTLSVILLTESRYFVLHVGDSRIYLADAWETRQLTQDQTLAMRELEAGRITEAEYQHDIRRNVLLQCIGDQSVSPVFQMGKTPEEGGVLLCSDGFYHTVSLEEISDLLRCRCEKEVMRQRLLALADRARKEGETDNITCVVFRWTSESMSGKRSAANQTPDSLASVLFINGEPL